MPAVITVRISALTALAALVILPPAAAANDSFRPGGSLSNFCAEVQTILAGTEVESELTIFDNMPDYRASKPSVKPLVIYQIVSYDEAGEPLMVSCKVKAADHLVDSYGPDAAGDQRDCGVISLRVKDAVVAALTEEDPEAGAAAEAIVLEPAEMVVTGQSYLADFEISFRGDDGRIHVNTKGLQVGWTDWLWWILPDRFRGQTYCHVIAPDHLAALARGDAAPGRVMSAYPDD